MIDDSLVLKVERLRDAVGELRDDIRDRYHTPTRPVISEDVREEAARLGERWLVEVAAHVDVARAVGEDVIADLSVDFQRLITYAESATARRKYDSTTRTILKDFRTRVVVPLKQARQRGSAPAPADKPVQTQEVLRVFIGQSFQKTDIEINTTVARMVEAFGYIVITGEKPKADLVSKKVRERIESAEIFLGIFTKRERIRKSNEWTTSTWVIDEKAYALAKGRKLILLRELPVQSIGGIQGDYEYVDFSRNNLPDLLIKLAAVLRSI